MDITEAQLGWLIGCALLLAMFVAWTVTLDCYATSECSAGFTGNSGRARRV